MRLYNGGESKQYSASKTIDDIMTDNESTALQKIAAFLCNFNLFYLGAFTYYVTLLGGMGV